MEWYVCKYESSGIMELLPDFYVNEMIVCGNSSKIRIIKIFRDGGEALEYLAMMVYADHLINKTLE